LVEVFEVLPGIFRIRYEYRDSIGYSSVYLVVRDKEAALIDAGTLLDSGKDVFKVLKRVGGTDVRIRYIVVTHPHPDHIGTLAWIKRKSRAEVFCYEGVGEVLKSPVRIFKENFSLGFASRLKLRATEPIFNDQEISGVDVDHELKNFESIEVGDYKFRTYHTGGHCRGHMALYERSLELLLSGDEVLCHPSSPFKFFMDKTGNSKMRERALKVFMELKPKCLLSLHDEPRMGMEAQIAIEQALEAHKIWKSTILDVVSEIGEGSAKDVYEHVKIRIEGLWTGALEFLGVLTTSVFLSELEEDGKVIRKENGKRAIWGIS